ncbi:hypothetical protein [Moraxella phage Mcat7]|nr:hypothetical protein [Moraxella phage Mcat7]
MFINYYHLCANGASMVHLFFGVLHQFKSIGIYSLQIHLVH